MDAEPLCGGPHVVSRVAAAGVRAGGADGGCGGALPLRPAAHPVVSHSAPHRTAAVTSLALFWSSLAAMVVGFSLLALRRRQQPAA